MFTTTTAQYFSSIRAAQIANIMRNGHTEEVATLIHDAQGVEVFARLGTGEAIVPVMTEAVDAPRRPSPTGVHYTFGEVWNRSVKAAKGIAISPANRDKLTYQGYCYEIENAHEIETKALCAMIAEEFDEFDLGE